MVSLCGSQSMNSDGALLRRSLDLGPDVVTVKISALPLPQGPRDTHNFYLSIYMSICLFFFIHRMYTPLSLKDCCKLRRLLESKLKRKKNIAIAFSL